MPPNLAFGPVPSRRLGNSLGVNNVPAKTCSYDCVYCQLGPAPPRLERRAFYDPADVLEAVRSRLEEVRRRGSGVDYLTFVPDGEPTLDLNLGKEIELLKGLGVPVAVITNSSLLFEASVRDDLRSADLVSVKVDACSERTWRLVDRPHKSLSLARVLQGLQDFSREYRGTLLTETMLVGGVDYSTEAEGLARLIAGLEPERAYLTVPTRPPAEPWVRPAPEGQVNVVLQAVMDLVPRVELLTRGESGEFGGTGEAELDLLATAAVHPMTQESAEELLRRDGAGPDLLERMLREEKLVRISYGGKTFYARRASQRADRPNPSAAGSKDGAAKADRHGP
ncbi:MAG: radical SAM protein, partial [Conexivisphaerales archaeon]|nr:radical SAM protein [Conexivisphaerales archaeon]